MQIRKKYNFRRKIALPTKYYRKHYTLGSLSTFSYYMHSVEFLRFQISYKCLKSVIYL